jgi:hypothetical protein
MNWLERARYEIRKSASRSTANSAERNPTAVMAVPHPTLEPNLRGCGHAMGAAPEDLPLRALLEEFEERAAIMEFDGGLNRQDAEREAALAVIGRYRLH